MSGRLSAWADSALVATSIALLLLLPVEIVSWLIVSDVADHDAAWVADRWASPLWRSVDWAFLVVALAHGGLSTFRWLVRGHPAGGWRPAVAAASLAVLLAVAVLASYTLFTFELR